MMGRFRRFLPHLLCLALFLLPAACATQPYTGDSQFTLISESQALKLGEDAANQVLKEKKLSDNAEYVSQVERVGKNISRVSIRPDWDWKFYVIEDDSANAFALPGGKVFVHTGILELAQSDDELATVMGHEIAHALLRHGSERMSTAMALNLGSAIGAAAMGGGSREQQAAMVAFGIGANVGVLLPFSRNQEREADKIGLRLMAEADYDPAAAVTFWQRMLAKKEEAGKDAPPEFLSTHPPTNERIETLRDLQAWAQQYRRS
ncbi:M48 family metallopeptidase [Desulfohalovibrio reitneri]|uniref:M48 family metallopeptidase n=1 Tax=Desulfohalovibrio reitneri TaxID=1307759 RepID=UPI0004A6D381|nr:M48 family metallopeptidase [Desulfohalovibrio reitneri]